MSLRSHKNKMMACRSSNVSQDNCDYRYRIPASQGKSSHLCLLCSLPRLLPHAGYPAFGMGEGGLGGACVRKKKEKDEKPKQCTQLRWMLGRAMWEMTNNYPETLSSTGHTRLSVLTLFKGSHRQRKMCDWRLLSQYHSAWCMNVWTHGWPKSTCVCANNVSQMLQAAGYCNATAQSNRQIRSSMQHAKHREWKMITLTYLQHSGVQGNVLARVLIEFIGLPVMDAFPRQSWKRSRERFK